MHTNACPFPLGVQIVTESFLEDINNMLNSGEVPGMFAQVHVGVNQRDGSWILLKFKC